MQEGKKIYRYRDRLSMPRGIEMKPYGGADGSLLFVGQYVNPEGAALDRPKRIYRVEVEYLAGSAEWYALVRDDARSIVRLRGKTKWTVANAALGALRGFLEYRCQNTNGNRKRRRRAAAAREPRVGTESAADALAATVRRQKGEE